MTIRANSEHECTRTNSYELIRVSVRAPLVCAHPLRRRRSGIRSERCSDVAAASCAGYRRYCVVLVAPCPGRRRAPTLNESRVQGVSGAESADAPLSARLQGRPAGCCCFFSFFNRQLEADRDKLCRPEVIECSNCVSRLPKGRASFTLGFVAHILSAMLDLQK